MRIRRLVLAVLAVVCVSSGAVAAPEPTVPAETVGLRSAEIAAVLETVRQRRIPLDSLYIERDGRPVVDLYVYPFSPGLRHDIASVSKSVSALTAGALFAGKPAYGMGEVLIPGQTLTLGDALSMRTGLACGDRPGEPELFQMMAAPNWAVAAASLPRRGPPGEAFSYCSPAYLLASAFVSRTTGAPLAEHAARLIFAPLGITDWAWPADPQGNTRAWGDLDLRAGDLVKIGRLLLDGGAYNGRQVVPAGWISAATTGRSVARNGDGYGYGFWLRRSAPGMVEGRGRGGQALIVWPSQRLLMVMTASDTDDGQTLPLLAGIRPQPGPLPPDTAGVRRLARAISALSEPPRRQSPGRPGPWASRLLKRPLDLEDQRWIRRLMLRQDGASGALHIESPYYSFDAPLGFDGVPRLGEKGPEGGAVAGSAVWLAPDHLVAEVRPYALAQRVTLDIRFERDRALVSVREASGLFSFDTTARPAIR